MDFSATRQELLRIANTLKAQLRSREISLALTATQNAMMVAGTLAGLTTDLPHPYPNDGKRKGAGDIEAFANPSSAIISVESGNNVELIDTLRQILKGIVNSLSQLEDLTGNLDLSEMEETKVMFSTMSLFMYLNEARSWLGMELGRIRDEVSSTSTS